MAKDDATPVLKAASVAAAMPDLEDAAGGVVPAWQPATTFERRAGAGFSYLRDASPVFTAAEAILARLEGGAEALLFASGMAAADAVFRALPKGAHALVPDVMYWALRAWLQAHHDEGALVVERFKGDDLDALAKALRPGATALVWVETPANPLWTVTDIARAAELAHGAGALLAVDSTAATPILTRPLDLGADIVMHSATKYLNGHSDVLAGALMARSDDEFWRAIRRVRTMSGAVPGSFEAWLLIRGMRTLAVRVERACENALALAEWLEGHDGVLEVLYPGLTSHPGHAVAARQMQGGFGGMLSFRVEGGFEKAARVAGATRLIREATSLGGVESLIEHRAPVEGPDSPCSDDLLRLSVGIEDIGDLKADLANALA
ncbi:MAG: aminotransferase class V-fold PLP-dependent enzyme [Rhodospirillaceae bacterium]